MIKQVTFLGKTASGIFVQPLFGEHWGFEKVAGAPAFSNWETGDQLKEFISKITPQQRKENAYTLVNALGAGEFFGSNINADFFPWNSLAHEGDDYGYKTFLNAHAFQHHRNKDPSRAFGRPALSVLNHGMKRVELIIELNREKARLEGADGIITRIDQGDFPAVSMGCKVPYDVCSICANQSKTEQDYCQHMRPGPDNIGIFGPNKILSDGRKIFVFNYTPRFFDLSFVFIGADKTAKVMAKLASARDNYVCLGDVCAINKPSATIAREVGSVIEINTPKEKTASVDCGCGGDCCHEAQVNKVFGVVKTSSIKKVGEIVKTVPAGVTAVKGLNEKDLPEETLKSLASVPLIKALSSSAYSGIVLKPREFQTIVLIRMGEPELAEDYNLNKVVFRDVPEIDRSIQIGKEGFDPAILSMLLKHLGERCILGPHLGSRIIKAKNKITLPIKPAKEDSFLDKISAAYNGYRESLLVKVAEVQKFIEDSPRLRSEILGYKLSDMFIKTAEAKVITAESLVYLTSMYTQQESLLELPIDTSSVELS